MGNNLKSPLALIAAFLAGALVLYPFVSQARPVDSDATSGVIAFQPHASDIFVVKNGNRIHLFRIQMENKKGKISRTLVPLDHKPL